MAVKTLRIRGAHRPTECGHANRSNVERRESAIERKADANHARRALDRALIAEARG